MLLDVPHTDAFPLPDIHQEPPEITLCPLMLTGIHTPKACRCDIETLRQAYLENHEDCHQQGDCLPRLESPREASNEAAKFYRLYF